MPDLASLTPDRKLALRSAARTLHDEFDGTFSTETIELYLHTSYDQFAGTAKFTNFLPLIAERFARQRLHALARVEGKHDDGTPIVLFLCVHNAGRSQMALGWFNHLAGDRAIAWSGGSEPGAEINPAAIEAMAEVGIDITGEFPKPWTDEIVKAADVVVTMGCGDACPLYPGKRYEDWELTDPSGLDVAAVRPVRDEIRTSCRHAAQRARRGTTAKLNSRFSDNAALAEELLTDRRRVEVDALADDPVAALLEQEHGEHARPERRPECSVGAEQVELDDDAVVDAAQHAVVVSLVGEVGPRASEVVAHLCVPVEHLTCRHQLIPGVRRTSQSCGRVLHVLRLHVLTHDGQPAFLQIRSHAPTVRRHTVTGCVP
ncbi:MAG: arsenate reductase ArsC [Ilumatobacteraceae bacterium]